MSGQRSGRSMTRAHGPPDLVSANGLAGVGTEWGHSMIHTSRTGIRKRALFSALITAALFLPVHAAPMPRPAARAKERAAGAAASSAPATRRERLEAIVQAELRARGEADRGRLPDDPSRFGPNRAVRALELLPAKVRRETARWFLQRYADGLLQSYYAAASTAIVILGESASKDGLLPEERRILEQLLPKLHAGTVPGLAKSVLLEDAFRGQPEELSHAYRRCLGPPGVLEGYLIFHGWQVEESLRDIWNNTERFQKYGKRNYEGVAGDHYFRFRAMKFPAVQAELEFLWGRILAQYERSSRLGEGPNDLEVYQFDEARAATARLIEIGRPAVPFLLAKSDFILRAADPQDPRSTIGDIYEIWVMRTLLDPAFTPLLKQLARCGSKKVENVALDALKRMECDDPYPYRALFVFQFRLTGGS